MRLPKGVGVVEAVRDPRECGNYLPKMVAILKGRPARSVTDILIRHEDHCPRINGGGRCTCDPDVSIMPPEARA